jgi:hypothetical protein
MVIERFAAGFQHSLTKENNAVLTTIIAPIRHAKSARRQMMWDSKRFCSGARPIA